MTILISDWASFNQVLPIALKYGIGMEIQEFTSPNNIDKAEELIKTYRDGTKSLPMVSLHGPFAELVPASMDPWVKQVAAKRFGQAYEIAHKTHAKHLILHSGFFPKTYGRDKWIQNSYDFWIDFINNKIEPGLIHLENVYEDDFSALQELIDRVNEARHEEMLTICLDIGHVNANSSRRVDDWISGLGDRIRYVHLHNNGGILDDHWRLDKGTIDISKVLNLLQKHSTHAIWSVETIVDDIEPSLAWLQRNGYLE